MLGVLEVCARPHECGISKVTRFQATCRTSCLVVKISSHSSRNSWQLLSRADRSNMAPVLTRSLSAAFLGIMGVSRSAALFALRYTILHYGRWLARDDYAVWKTTLVNM